MNMKYKVVQTDDEITVEDAFGAVICRMGARSASSIGNGAEWETEAMLYDASVIVNAMQSDFERRVTNGENLVGMMSTAS